MKIAMTLVFAALSAAVLSDHETSAVSGNKYTLIPIAESAVHHHRGVTNDPRVRESDSEEHGTSSNWSGYAVQTDLASPQDGVVSNVVGSWTVPAATKSKSKSTYSSNWVGIDGYSNGTVEQLGTESDWSHGAPSYYAWFEMYPNRAFLISGFTVRPDDVITASVHYAGGTSYVLTIDNVTHGDHFTTTQNSSAALRSSAEWVAEAPSTGRVLPLANFGTTTFSGCSATIAGHTGPINDGAWQYDAITMSAKNVVKATPSSLSADGSGFSVVWSHE
jgi:hypothetical protein